MNLRDLHYFVTVSETLHFGRAAKACNVSQPTLSMQLRKLELYLGAPLFERAGHKVLLTEVGKSLLPKVRRIVSEAEGLRAVARRHLDPRKGEITFAIFPTLAPYLLPILMPALRQHFPKLTLLLKEEKSPDILERLESGALDCACLALPFMADNLVSKEMFTEPFLLAVPKKHRLAVRAEVSIDDLKSENLLLLDEGHCLRDQALQVCAMAGIGEEQNFRATSLETLRQMVAANGAVTLMPKLAVGRDSENPSVAYIPFEDNPPRRPMPKRDIALVWRETSPRKELFEEMALVISGIVAERLGTDI